jgi:F-type H+-transporting ATPase subunit b
VRIEATKTEALGEIEAETVDAVQAIVTKLSGVTADRVSVTKQVKAALANG